MGAQDAEEVQAQYGRTDIWATIASAIRDAGLDPDRLTLDDLAPLDEFHIGGRQASAELAEMAGLVPGSRVLDVGSGLGGPARLLADRFGCLVTALDVTEEYCRAAEMLNRATGLADRVRVRQGSALALPFATGEFDAVWTQHASMNISEKSVLYAEIRRVLRPGGTLALHDVHAGPVQPIWFPVPWADTPSVSFLVAPQEARSLVVAAGFELVRWRDRTPESIEFFRRRGAGSPRAGLGLQVYVPELAAKTGNLARNLETDRLRVSQATFRAAEQAR